MGPRDRSLEQLDQEPQSRQATDDVGTELDAAPSVSVAGEMARESAKSPPETVNCSELDLDSDCVLSREGLSLSCPRQSESGPDRITKTIILNLRQIMYGFHMVPGSPTGSDIEGEVTRIEQVRYLKSGPGHSVISLLFLVLSGILIWVGYRSVAWVTVIVAFGVVLNGASIFLWDWLRARIVAAVERPDEADSNRTLTPHRISTQAKVQMGAGLLMIGTFVVMVALLVETLTRLGSRIGFLLLFGGLALGNLGALSWMYYTSSRV